MNFGDPKNVGESWKGPAPLLTETFARGMRHLLERLEKGEAFLLDCSTAPVPSSTNAYRWGFTIQHASPAPNKPEPPAMPPEPNDKLTKIAEALARVEAGALKASNVQIHEHHPDYDVYTFYTTKPPARWMVSPEKGNKNGPAPTTMITESGKCYRISVSDAVLGGQTSGEALAAQITAFLNYVERYKKGEKLDTTSLVRILEMPQS